MYYKQLNFVRAVAVMMVIVYHWTANNIHFLIPLGSWGVEMFFVLSGFLITRILIESRAKADSQKQSKIAVIKNFLLRRCLRIFPIYYLSLVLILFFDRTNISELKDNLWYFIGYASNFLYFNTQQFNFPMAHFWSLAVEEQFYLVWPWFILFLPLKYIKTFLIWAIVFGLASRMFLSFMFPQTIVTVDVLTPSCIDSFSIGGLFSYYTLYYQNNIEVLVSKISKIGLVAFVLSVTLLITNTHIFSTVHRTIDSLFFLALIANAYKGVKGMVGAIADNPVLIYIGKISYGLYIYHLLTPWITKVILVVLVRFKSGLIYTITRAYNESSFMVRFLLDFIILVSVSSLSWHFIEKPINKYKNSFR